MDNFADVEKLLAETDASETIEQSKRIILRDKGAMLMDTKIKPWSRSMSQTITIVGRCHLHQKGTP